MLYSSYIKEKHNMTKFEEVISGYKKSLGLLKQIDTKVYKMFTRELERVGREEVSAIIAGLKYNIGVQESIAKGIDKGFQTHRLDKSYIKGKHQFLTLSINQKSFAFYFDYEKKSLFGKKKHFILTLLPLDKEPEQLDATTFATTNKVVNHKVVSRHYYTIEKENDCYIARKNDVLNDTTEEIELDSIPEVDSALTTPVIGY